MLLLSTDDDYEQLCIAAICAMPQAIPPAQMGSAQHRPTPVIARSEATKQSILFSATSMDCFAERVIGSAFALPVGSQ